MSTFGFDRLLRNRRGNVAMMYALVAPILVFGGGAAVDYGRAAQIHTKLNAAADAAALAALTPSMLQQSSSVAQAAAESMFNGLTNGIPGLTAHATQVTVTITVGSTALIRNVAVAYSSSVDTIFAQVLGKSALLVSGVSEASAQLPHNFHERRNRLQVSVLQRNVGAAQRLGQPGDLEAGVVLRRIEPPLRQGLTDSATNRGRARLRMARNLLNAVARHEQVEICLSPLDQGFAEVFACRALARPFGGWLRFIGHWRSVFFSIRIK
ncbi:MAG TPA: pilus assembly protein TadG-related protein [Roseiarcus sp.]|nr:pilus assembly protein TadG-related protein [Roseiarcus sp.]